MDLEARLAASPDRDGARGFAAAGRRGTWVTAKPLGVRDGRQSRADGSVRRIDIAQIRQPSGWSDRPALPDRLLPTGEAFNLRNADIAEAVAKGLARTSSSSSWSPNQGLGGWPSMPATRDNSRSVGCARGAGADRVNDVRGGPQLPARRRVRGAVGRAARASARHRRPSPCCAELYTRDGAGLMIAADDDYDAIRPATVEDARAIAGTHPAAGGPGCAASAQPRTARDRYRDLLGDRPRRHGHRLQRPRGYADDLAPEFACVVVHPEYRRRDLAAALLRRAGRGTRAGYRRLFALTTHTPHWFLEHGFTRAPWPTCPRPKPGRMTPPVLRWSWSSTNPADGIP